MLGVKRLHELGAIVHTTRDLVTSITHKNSSHSTISAESYSYDDVGNLSSKTVNSVTTSYGYDDIDQLTSESRTGYSAYYTYDANGNRLTKTLGGVTETYTVDDADKLTSISVGGSTTKSYSYDAAGRTTSVVTFCWHDESEL
jgi:YD repeat-containing protein